MMTTPDILKKRAKLLHLARSFFLEREITEVDCPCISQGACIDTHITPFSLDDPKRYLFTSPEYGMKRLLCQGMEDIYQLSHVFRQEESSPLHNPEFTLAEWYRLNYSYEEMVEETLDFLKLFLPEAKVVHYGYFEALELFTGISRSSLSKDTLLKILEKHSTLSEEVSKLSEETLLPLVFSFAVEPNFSKQDYTLITNYPKEQAALAKVVEEKEGIVAKRFEIYFQGIELANGYEELQDPEEQKKRFFSTLEERNENLPVDTRFLKSLEKGLPACCGVAVGFDRLVMLHLNKSSIKEVLPFCWEEA